MVTDDFGLCNRKVVGLNAQSRFISLGNITDLPLTPSASNRVLELELEAGELRLTKYDTGYPFVGAEP